MRVSRLAHLDEYVGELLELSTAEELTVDT